MRCPALSSFTRLRVTQRPEMPPLPLLQFEKWGITHRSLAIFEEQESINRKVLARFSDVCEKQFSTLTANRERITRFLHEAVSE